MNEDLMKKLVDLYAERELPAEIEDPLEMAASRDAELRREMATLRTTVDTIRRDRVAYTEETHARILGKIEALADVELEAPALSRDQFSLPIYG